MSSEKAPLNARHSPPERDQNLRILDGGHFDTLVIGAGINGAVAAAALAGAGTRVAVVDKGDFAGGVSSSSSNLAWGGIKYLESGELRLVRKLCLSRNRLMDAYPSTVEEIRFFASIRRGFRMWSIFVWAGALLYWLMGNCRMAPPRYLTPRQIQREAPVVAPDEIVGGIEYSDCYLHDNDSRFVFNFVRKAMDSGANAVNYLTIDAMTWDTDESLWRVAATDNVSGRNLTIKANSIVNATGPGADPLNAAVGIETEHHHVLSKGIHLIVDRVTDLHKVLTFFASDGRLFFVIPMGPKTCIGTTDTQVNDPAVGVTEADRDFVLANANAMLRLPRPLTADDVIAERVGVRPLALAGARDQQDWVQLSRKHEIEVDRGRRYLSIFGGKLTDCINVGDELVAVIEGLGIPTPSAGGRWYGEPALERRAAFLARAASMELDRLTPDDSPEPLSLRFWRRYGEAAFTLLDAIAEDPAEAELILAAADYTKAEIRLAAEREMIVELKDFMRRRSKIEQVIRRQALAGDPGLVELGERLFGNQSDTMLAAYFQA